MKEKYSFLSFRIFLFLASWLSRFLVSWLLGFTSRLPDFPASGVSGFLASGFLSLRLLGYSACSLHFLASWHLLGFLAFFLASAHPPPLFQEIHVLCKRIIPPPRIFRKPCMLMVNNMSSPWLQ